MPQPTDGMPQFYHQHCLAQAVYDNTPDSPDELAFRKGDTLTVLEQNTGNLQGWWLCSLHGKQGICPGNRLRLIPGVYTDSDPRRVHSPHFSEISSEFSCQGKRRSWHSQQPNQIITSKKCGDMYEQAPCPAAVPSPLPSDCYDVPPARIIPIDENSRPPSSCQGHTPRCSPACVSPVTPRGSAPPCDAYDTPRALFYHHTPPPPPSLHPNPLTPSSSASSLTADSLSSSNRSSLANMPDYDVPRPVAIRIVQQHQVNYDVPVQVKELPLELRSALENLERLESDATSSISKLLGFVSPSWRSPEKLETTLMDIKLAATRLRASLHDLAEFGEGTLGNASKATDKNLAGKLSPLVVALKRSDKLVNQAMERLDDARWPLAQLARPHDDAKPDDLDHLVACARVLTEDVRQIASFIQGNGTLLFRKEAAPPASDEYDYVSLESKESVARTNAEIRAALPKELRKGFDGLVKGAEEGVASGCPGVRMVADDRLVVVFYAAQFVTHHKRLNEAIDAFLVTMERNQPPKIFLAHGKFIVLSAHKLIHIGDTVHRNVACREVRERTLKCANAMADALANSVNKTKQAAVQFPSVNAVQEMINAISEVAHSARTLKVCLVEAATPM